MRLPEQKLWDRLSHLMSGVWQAQRVENRVGPNTPDVFFTHPSIHGWIELKVYNPPHRPKTPWRLPHWTAGQQEWARRFAAQGCPVWLVVHFAHSDRIYVLAAQEALQVHGKILLADFHWRYDSGAVSWKMGDAAGILDRLRRSWYDSPVGAAMAPKVVGPTSTK